MCPIEVDEFENSIPGKWGLCSESCPTFTTAWSKHRKYFYITYERFQIMAANINIPFLFEQSNYSKDTNVLYSKIR